MLCQLKGLDEAVIDFSAMERLPRLVYTKISRTFNKILMLKGIHADSTALFAAHHGPSFPATGTSKQAILPLHLKSGEKVRVKSVEEIRNTLDKNNKFHRLAFTPVMWKFCGNTYTVLKKMEKVFDERKWKLSKVKNMILLDGVYCDGAGGIDKIWDGCDRTCFIWWKEGWLERITE